MVFVEVCIRDATILPKADIIFLIAFFFPFYSVNKFFTVYFVMQFYLFIFSLCFTASCYDSQVVCPDLPNGFCSAYFYWSWQNCRRSCGFCSGEHSTPKFCQFSQFMLALRIIHMVGYRSSRLNQNKPFAGPVSTLLSSLAEFYTFSLSGRLRAVGLVALTMCHNSLYTIN